MRRLRLTQNVIIIIIFIIIIIIIYLIAKGEPGALLRDREAARVVVDCGVVDVREHVIGSDDVMPGVRALSPAGNA